MTNINLAQHEQILKSLEQSLKEIGDQHKLMLDSLTELQTHYRFASHYIKESWSQILHLFVKVEQLRLTRLEFEQEKQ